MTDSVKTDSQTIIDNDNVLINYCNRQTDRQTKTDNGRPCNLLELDIVCDSRTVVAIWPDEPDSSIYSVIIIVLWLLLYYWQLLDRTACYCVDSNPLWRACVLLYCGHCWYCDLTDPQDLFPLLTQLLGVDIVVVNTVRTLLQFIAGPYFIIVDSNWPYYCGQWRIPWLYSYWYRRRTIAHCVGPSYDTEGRIIGIVDRQYYYYWYWDSEMDWPHWGPILCGRTLTQWQLLADLDSWTMTSILLWQYVDYCNGVLNILWTIVLMTWTMCVWQCVVLWAWNDIGIVTDDTAIVIIIIIDIITWPDDCWLLTIIITVNWRLTQKWP